MHCKCNYYEVATDLVAWHCLQHQPIACSYHKCVSKVNSYALRITFIFSVKCNRKGTQDLKSRLRLLYLICILQSTPMLPIYATPSAIAFSSHPCPLNTLCMMYNPTFIISTTSKRCWLVHTWLPPSASRTKTGLFGYGYSCNYQIRSPWPKVCLLSPTVSIDQTELNTSSTLER